MIITKNWLSEWINLGDVTTDELCVTLNKIGLEVASVTRYRPVEKCVIGYVQSKVSHPNAEKLSVCSVDVGDDLPLQIVCGAKNVDKGQFVPVALVGCVLPSGVTITQAELRGVVSNGMICSSSELGYPKTNDGILIFDNNSGELKAGTPLISIPELRDDAIEIELTPNRGDCLSIYGIARDLSAAYNTKVRAPQILGEDSNQIGIGRVLDLRVEGEIDSSLVYKALYQKELRASTLMDLRLAMIDSPAKSLIDKYLAYATHATGVILRSYKMSVFARSNTTAENSENEKIEIVVKKDANNLDSVWGKELLSYIGVWQDDKSKACDDDDLVVIEASFSDPNALGHNNARGAQKSDWALFKSLRGSETDLDFGINYAAFLLDKSSKVGILNGSERFIKEAAQKQVGVDLDDMFAIIGSEINKTDVISILKNLGFHTVFNPEQNSLIVDIPSFRHDVENIQDICEEIVRIVGIDNIRSKPLKFAEFDRTNRVYRNFEKKKFYRYRAVAAGFFESVSYIFTDRDMQKKYGFECVAEELDLSNPITNDLNTLRTTNALNLTLSTARNVNAGAKSVCLFEVGKVFNANRDERVVMSFIASGQTHKPNPANHGKPDEFDFPAFADKIAAVLGVFDIVPAKPDNKFFSPYEYGHIMIEGENIGFIGRVAVGSDFDLPKTYVCEVAFDKLPYARKIAKAYSKLPSVTRDLSLLVPKELFYSDIEACLKENAPKELKDFYAIDVYEDESLGDKKSLTLTLVFEPDEKTFTDEQINAALEQILESLLLTLRVSMR